MEGMMEGLQGVKDGSGIDVGQGFPQQGQEMVPAHVETSGGRRIPHIGMASAFSHRLEANSYSRARRERVEMEIQQSGVSVRNLRSNFEGQIGGIYPSLALWVEATAWRTRQRLGPQRKRHRWQNGNQWWFELSRHSYKSPACEGDQQLEERAHSGAVPEPLEKICIRYFSEGGEAETRAGGGVR